MELIAFLNDGNIANFLLLILRFSGVIAFFPFFDSKLIPTSLKAVMIFFLAILFTPLTKPFDTNISILEFMVAGLSEITFGFFGAFLLQVVFAALAFAGDVLGFGIGMSISMNYDPVSGTQNLIITQLLTLSAILVSLTLDFHHLIMQFIASSLQSVPLGGFMLSDNMLIYFVKSFSTIFLIGFTMALPVIGIIFLSDIIFGMITRAHPQFNLLVIGLPFKIIIALLVLVITFSGVIFHFKIELLNAFNNLSQFLKSISRL